MDSGQSGRELSALLEQKGMEVLESSRVQQPFDYSNVALERDDSLSGEMLCVPADKSQRRVDCVDFAPRRQNYDRPSCWASA